MVRNFFFNRNRRIEAQQTVPPQSTVRSIDHTEFGTLGQSLQQELKLVAQFNRLQIRCAIREGILLVLTEHLLHVEPDPQQTFVVLEQTVREITPQLLEADPTCSLTVHSRPLPVRLYLRVAGYQQPYAFHSFTLEPSHSTKSELVDTVDDRALNAEAPEPVIAESDSIDLPEVSTSEVGVEIGTSIHTSERYTSESHTPEISAPENHTPESDTPEIVDVSHLEAIAQPVEAEPVESPALVEPPTLVELPSRIELPAESSALEPTPESEAEAIDNRLELAVEPSIVEELPASVQLPAESESVTEPAIPEESAVEQSIEEPTNTSLDQPQVDLVIAATEVNEPVADIGLNEAEIDETGITGTSPIVEFVAEPLENVSFDDIEITESAIESAFNPSESTSPEITAFDISTEQSEITSIELTQTPSLLSADAISETSVDSFTDSFTESVQTEIVGIEVDAKEDIAVNIEKNAETTSFIENFIEAELNQEPELEQGISDESIAVDRVQTYIAPESILDSNSDNNLQNIDTDNHATELQFQDFSGQVENTASAPIWTKIETVDDSPIETNLDQASSQDVIQDLYTNATQVLDTDLAPEQVQDPIVEPELESEIILESEPGPESESEIISSRDDFCNGEVELYPNSSHEIWEEQANGSIAQPAKVETTSFEIQATPYTDLEQTYSEQISNGSTHTNSLQTSNTVEQFSYRTSDAETVPETVSDGHSNLTEATEKIQPIRLIPNVQKSASSFDRLPLDVGDDMAQTAFRSRLTLSNVMLTGAVGLFFVVCGVYVFTRPCVLSKQCVPLQQAQQLTQRSLTALQTNPSALEVVDAYDQLTQANQLLEKVPFWSGSYQQAQTLTAEYSGQVEELSLVVQALNRANIAAKKSISPPHPISVWREVQLTWREAISLLEQVPASSSVYGLARNKLAEYQSNLGSINTRIVVEQNALDRLEAVKKAADVTDARSKIVDSADSWQQTYTSWQTILDQLQQIPQGTMAYSEAQRLSRVYQLQLEAAENRRSQEERSTNAYNQAIALADQARRLDQEGQVSQAIDYWREAITTVKQVSEGTTSYNQAQSLLNSYLASLNQSEQRAKQMTLVQTVEPQLNQICTGSYTLCTYTLTTEAIRVQLTAEYDQIVIQALQSVQRSGNFGMRGDTAERVNQFLQSLSSISESVRVPVELYSAGGIKFGTYDLNQSGYVLP